ncbi:nicotinate phosphoribosyltransferase [Desulfacinum hydrothermale DSM 13146]|uniref:Nicotinate phosphoribosyltransferase n=1 Tax=Desulfacinum hydrothermale DSM 13146 TaxID=1121390 RepID=A0A1W1XHV3_9BACT|nr:nicotinate phosphoribosyltransferase [Desulfacinum hydrothermale]SMC23573.1 nicotinate phosphoribosyltransferase [Desulfacinum hydrothermale DSM 13146]
MHLWNGYRPEMVTDYYQFTMAASYWQEGMEGQATFSLFIRDYPPQRAYFVAAGLESLAAAIQEFRFHPDSLNYLQSLGKFPEGFLDYLARFRFTGSVRALPEGRIFFAQEPLLEVSAPIIQGQILETLALNTLHQETLIASKAARCVAAARGRPLVDFSLRRTQGVDAGLKTARSSYIAGFLGTSNVLAGQLYGIPVYGTMAHSYITSFPHEADAFQAYARVFPDNTVLLLDTYDTLKAAEKAVALAKELRQQGKALRGVRLDSGDLLHLSQKVKDLFRSHGLDHVAVMASGNLDEYRLEELLSQGACIDAAGIGTRLGVSADAPYLDMAYKLVEYEGRPILKLSPAKTTWVGRKQVFRSFTPTGTLHEDVLGLAEEPMPGTKPLLVEVFRQGERIRSEESLETIRRRFDRDWNRLPEPYKALRPTQHYPVRVSRALQDLQDRVTRDRRRDEVGSP